MLTKDKEIEIVDKYNQGVSISQLSREYNIYWRGIKNILINNGVTTRTFYHIDENYFDVIDTPNKAYILGFLYADGANTSNYDRPRYCVSICLKQDDYKILEAIRDEIGYSEAPIKLKQYGKTPTAKLDICNKHIVLRLHELGIIPNKTFTIKFPEWLSQNLYSHFIRGYFDGDGCLTHGTIRRGKTQAAISIAGTSDFCYSLSDIIEHECGVTAHVNNTGGNCNPLIKVLTAHGNIKCKKILDYIYRDADLKLERKYQKYINWYYNN